MKTVYKQLIAALVLSGGLQCALAADVHWTYEGEHGPDHWGDLSPSYLKCKIGAEQSPVDIDYAQDSNLSLLMPRYKSASVNVFNNGHTIQHNISNGSSTVIDNEAYNLVQYHLHTPSEHTLRGASYPMEIHFVHKNAKGQLAVLGVFVREGAENPALATLLKNSPTTEGVRVDDKVFINLNFLLPSINISQYFRYNGSLTTPPCSEGVKWHVSERAISASRSQLSAFKKLFHGLNARPLQPLNTRIIRERD